MSSTTVSLSDKYALDTTRAYLTGVEALVRLPILQHQRDLERGLSTAGFVSGYRGSPLGGVDQAMWNAGDYLKKHDIVFQPGINEDLAATAVWGSQQVNLFPGAKYDGVFGMWYGKGPGVDRSMDAIRHANAFGTSRYGGVLAVAGDDHAAKSSTLPHQSEHLFIGASIPVLSPANVQEVLDLGIYGWELSRYCGTWVAMKAITENMDSAISAEIDPGRINIVVPEDFPLPLDGVHARWPDTALAQEERLNTHRIYAAREFARVNRLNRIVLDSDKPRLGIITTGKAYLDVMQALEDLGIDAPKASSLGLRVFKVGMSWPLEPTSTHEFAKGLDEILVVEEKRSIIEDQLTGQLYNYPVAERPRVVGEFDEHGGRLLTNLSELTPAMVARAIAGRLARYYSDPQIAERLAFYDRKEQTLSAHGEQAQRTPHYCSGCPHSVSTQIPSGSRALGGIGCHYMGIWESGNRRAETFTQMGGEGVTWVGQAPFTHTSHVFQNLGDGTYFHSGLLAIRQAVASGVNITYKILFNDAVAMTGGQSVDGDLSVEAMVQQLKGEGIHRIAIVAEDTDRHRNLPSSDGVTIDHRDALLDVESQLRDTEGTTVLIFDQVCAAEKRRRRRKGELAIPTERVFINQAVCEGCGDCSVQSNCLSVVPVETELGRKRRIDQYACNLDKSCLKGFCPSFVTVSGDLRRAPAVDAAGPRPLPEPVLAAIDERPWNIVITGVGGTGILTVAALLAMAAHIEGRGCATMNQTGLAQKFGAVISHVRIGISQDAINAVRIPAGDADLLLGCDLLVSASPDAIAKVDSTRTHSVINTHASPGAEFMTDPDARVPSDSLRTFIRDETGADSTHFISATDLATSLTGDPIGTNLFLLGYAFQLGLIPVSSKALHQAIELNNVAVDFNRRAFDWGRRAALDEKDVSRQAGQQDVFKPLVDVDEIVRDRVSRLTDYQSAAYAERYRSVIQRIRDAESRAELNNSEEFTRRAARSLFRLMAYKDEYEVARLYNDDAFSHALAEQFEDGYKLAFHMAPPLLSAGGRKLRLPGATRSVLKLLAPLRRLRGTRFDPFGYSRERRLERQLIVEFEALFLDISARLSEGNYDIALTLADLPQSVRGYGHVKLANGSEMMAQRTRLMARFDGKLIPVALAEAA